MTFSNLFYYDKCHTYITFVIKRAPFDIEDKLHIHLLHCGRVLVFSLLSHHDLYKLLLGPGKWYGMNVNWQVPEFIATVGFKILSDAIELVYVMLTISSCE